MSEQKKECNLKMTSQARPKEKVKGAVIGLGYS